MSREVQMPLAIDDIAIGDSHRAVNTAAVKRLADSIDKIGLRHPITVREKGDQYLLVAGRHRMEAFRKLGRDFVPACIVKMTNDDARLWEIAENLHRAELSNIEKSECIEEWRKITARQEVRNSSAPSQPKDDAIRKTAEALGVDEKTVRYSGKIAQINPEAKQAAAEAGTTTVRELLEVAAEPQDRQPAKVHELSERRSAKTTSAHPKDEHERAMEWRRSFERVWNQSPRDEDREWARTWIDTPIMDGRYGS